MKAILTFLILMAGINVFAQGPGYDVSKDAKNGELVFNGPLTFEELKKEQSFSWLKKGYEEYTPNAEMTSYLDDNIRNFSMVVFLGTWCDDSHDLVPKLEKLLDVTHFPASKLTMYGVDREKKTKNGEHKTYNITLVPTIILVDKDGKEAGRVTETVTKSIEEDLATIISKTIRGGYRARGTEKK